MIEVAPKLLSVVYRRRPADDEHSEKRCGRGGPLHCGAVTSVAVTVTRLSLYRGRSTRTARMLSNVDLTRPIYCNDNQQYRLAALNLPGFI